MPLLFACKRNLVNHDKINILRSLHELLKLLNKLMKRDKTCGLPSVAEHFIAFSQLQ